MTLRNADATDAEPPLGGPQVDVQLPPSEDGSSFEAWRGYLAFAGDSALVDPDSRSAFQAGSRIYVLQPFTFGDSHASHPHKIWRTPQDVARTGLDLINITLHLAGSYVGVCDATAFAAGAGDVSITDYALPFAFEISAFRSLSLVFPRSAAPASMRERALHGLVPPMDDVATRLLADALRAFHEALPGLTNYQAVAVAQSIVALVDGATSTSPTRTIAPRAPLSPFDRARAEIAQRLQLPDLSAEQVAKAIGISRSALYALFERKGGVLAYIRECRLQACYETLVTDLKPGEKIGAIARGYGFVDEAQFSRAFEERYGVGPRAVRSMGRKRRAYVAAPRPEALPTTLMATLGKDIG